MDTKKFIKEVINVYEMYLEVLKKKKKNKESAKLVGTIFGLKEGYNLYDEVEIKKLLDLGKETYINQEDEFECGKIDGLFSIYRIIRGENIEMFHLLVQVMKVYNSNIVK